MQQLSDKHAQRIARITDDRDIKMKASMQEMSSKYEMYSHSMSQQKREINDLIFTFQSKREQQQAQVNTMLKSHTEEVDKSLVEVRQCQTTILESQNMIKEMKTEICDMLEEMKHRMIRETYNIQSHVSQHSNDRLRASARKIPELEPHDGGNKVL